MRLRLCAPPGVVVRPRSPPTTDPPADSPHTNIPTSLTPTQRFLDWVASKARPGRPRRAAARTPRAAAADLQRRLSAAADARAAQLARVTAAAAQTSLRSAEAAVRRASRAADEAAASVRRAQARRAAAERRAEATAARVNALKLRGRVVSVDQVVAAVTVNAAAVTAARTIQAEWRAFAATHRPTTRLAAAFVETGVLVAEGEPEVTNGEPQAPSPPRSPPPPAAVLLVPGASPPPRRTPFDDFADVLRSGRTLMATRCLLARLEDRAHGRSPTTPSRPSRYRPREFLCAFMLLTHPDVVLSRATGARETALTKASARLRGATVDVVAAWLTAGALPPHAAKFASPGPPTQRAAVTAFDAAWRAYEAAFRAWKVADAACLEADLASAAAGLESSRLAVEAARAAAAAAATSDDSDAPRAPARRVATADDAAELAAAVERDVALLRERAAAVAGPAAAARVDAAVAAARARARLPARAPTPTPPQCSPPPVSNASRGA